MYSTTAATMSFRFFGSILLFFLLTSSVVAAKRVIFKTCSEVPFCAKFRSHQPNSEEKFQVDFSTLSYINNVASMTLRNDKKQNVLLTLQWSKHTARLIITEPGKQRFFLKAGQALGEEPRQYELGNVNKTKNKAVIFNHDNTERIELENSPYFSLTAFNGLNEKMMTLKSDKLYMENANNSQVFTFSIDFNAPRLYGLFDHSWRLALCQTAVNGLEPFRLRNGDPWGFKDNSPMALYGSVPAIYGHSSSQTSGIFLHNAAEQWIDIAYPSENVSSAYFVVESAAFDLFLLFGPGPKEVVRQMTDLTGRAPLPQLWTLGYHQCRFSYKSQEDVQTVTALMEANKFPMDAIWLDGDHTDSYRWFRWNKNTFKKPLQMFKNISHYKKVAVSISDPHIKIDNNYTVYAGAKGRYFVKWDNGSDYEGRCWPGLSSWIDFLNPKASSYYSSWFAYNKFNGTNPTLAGIWNDMNEPSVYNNSNENTFPFEVIHQLDENGTTVMHRDVHNIYGLMHTQATFHGLVTRDNYKKRPFILTRSHFAGSQRYAAVWTGDNNSTWEHFANSFSQCMTGNLLAMVFCGADVGGFFGNTSHELLQRWYQGAAWLPFFRGHSDRYSARREPYLFPKNVQNVIREAIKLRYKHIPYWYTLFFEHASIHGGPLISPLFYHYPGIQERDHQILVGENIMAVAVVNSTVTSVEVVFPGEVDNIWYRIDNSKSYESYYGGQTKYITVDMETSPVFYRGGGIIVTYDVIRTSTFQMHNDPFVAYVNLDKDGVATGRIYVDDYTSYNYLANEDYEYWDIKYNHTDFEVSFKRLGGKSKSHNIHFRYIVVTSNVTHVFSTTKDGTKLEGVYITEETKFKLQ